MVFAAWVLLDFWGSAFGSRIELYFWETSCGPPTLLQPCIQFPVQGECLAEGLAQGSCISKTLTQIFGEKMIEIGVRFGAVFWTPDLGPRIGPLFVSYVRNKSGAQNGVTFLLPFWAPEIVVFCRSYVFKLSRIVGPFPIDDRCLGMFPTKKPGMRHCRGTLAIGQF